MSSSATTAILLGGGRGTRMQECTEDKILMMVQGKPLFMYSLEAFIESGVVDNIVFVYRDLEQKKEIESSIQRGAKTWKSLKIFWAQGGERRQDSVLSGLKSLEHEPAYVFIHDLARPLIQPESIRKIYRTLLGKDAAVLAHAVVDTIKQISPESKTLEDLNRDTLWAMETPQAFRYSLIYRAYEEVEKRDLKVTDDAAALNVIGHFITIVENCFPNPKITLQKDVDYLEFLLTKNHYATV